MNTFVTQAAAEYVGVAMSGLMQSIGSGLRSAGTYAENNPLVIVAVVGVLLFFVRVLGRRRR